MPIIISDAAMLDLAERAWGVIANASGGDWDKESADWRLAAEIWRDEYHRLRRELAFGLERAEPASASSQTRPPD